MKRKIEFNEDFANQVYNKKLKGNKNSKNIANFIWKLLKIFCLVLSILVIIKIAKGIWMFNRMYNVDVLSEMKYKYNEEFIIISKNVTDTGTGTYILSPKNNENITFNASNKGITIKDDYRETAIKYYTEKYVKENNILNIKSTEKKQPDGTFENCEFLYYDFWFELSSYNQIEDTVKIVYNIVKYITQNTKSDFMFNIAGKIKLSKYESLVQYSKFSTLDSLIYQEKYYYLNYLKENSLNTSNININEIQTIWKPEKLKIVINNNELKNTENRPLLDNSIATYNTELKDYELSISRLIENIDSIKKLENGNIKYNGKEYNINEDTNISNCLPSQCSITIIEKTFNANINYDYTNKYIYINIE